MVGYQPEWRPANDAHRRHANPVSISTRVRADEPARAAARQLAGEHTDTDRRGATGCRGTAHAYPERGAKLLLEFSNDCWVEVKDAEGKVLISSLQRANSSESLSGPAPFAITLGNAPAARLTLDGQPIDKAVYVPRRGTVSRFTLARPQP